MYYEGVSAPPLVQWPHPPSQVVPVDKLKTHYNTYERRRQLASMYDLFLVDRRVAGIITDKLGKSFLQKKNHPYPVDFRRRNLVSEMDQAIGSSYLRLSKASSFTVKIGRVSMTGQQLRENIEAAMAKITSLIPRGWGNVQALNVKTLNSVALPIFNSLPLPPTHLPQVGTERETKTVTLEPVKEEPLVPEVSFTATAASSPQVKYSTKRVRGSRILNSGTPNKRSRKSN